ncbi:hypothetical protein TNIN_228591 [Trichonephila inaurata madagascariensis]|uniref:Uncharacterized protein n=1 Tax=Trichonephila inaurata madagascariensis TaxID=2747483 RepID=A0A8X6WUZ3_9ARAC|nr:hypothetical protein TNIN_228591 [Trichonephila inaurata madagascariensis]
MWPDKADGILQVIYRKLCGLIACRGGFFEFNADHMASGNGRWRIFQVIFHADHMASDNGRWIQITWMDSSSDNMETCSWGVL